MPYEKKTDCAGGFVCFAVSGRIYIIFLVPFLWSVVYSLTGGVGGLEFVGLKHYQSLLQSRAFLLAAKNTLRFLAVSVPLAMFLGLGISLVLYETFQGRSFCALFFCFR